MSAHPANPSNRIDAAFAKLKERKRKAFIPYIMAGVPGPRETVELALELERLGADVLELGYPFSDPMADGVVNQAAANQALEQGMDSDAFFGVVREIRARSAMPMVVMTYFNPLFRIGFDTFARRAREAGVDGFLIVDLPVEESAEYLAACRREGLAMIFLVAPTTTPQRLSLVLEESSGFIYYISRTGITGDHESFRADLEEKLAGIKAATRLPVVVGFGISTPEHVRAVCRVADGAVVGSALVRRTLEKKPFEEIRKDMIAFAAPLIAPTKEAWT